MNHYFYRVTPPALMQKYEFGIMVKVAHASSLITHIIFKVHISLITLYLGDCCTLESFLAVNPSALTRDALRPVALQPDIGGEAGGIRQAEVQAECTGRGGLISAFRARALPAVMGRCGPCEDAHHLVEGEEDLG